MQLALVLVTGEELLLLRVKQPHHVPLPRKDMEVRLLAQRQERHTQRGRFQTAWYLGHPLSQQDG